MASSVTTSRQVRAWAWYIALLGLMMLPNLVWWWLDHSAVVSVEALILPTVLLLLVAALFGKRIWLLCLLLAPFAALSPVEAVYIGQYESPSTAAILATVFASNPREVREYLGDALVPVVVSAVLGLTLALLAARLSWRANLRWQHRSRGWVLLIAIVIPIVSATVAWATIKGKPLERMRTGTMSLITESIEPGYPFGVLQRVVAYRRQWTQMREGAARLDAFRFQARRVSPIAQRQVYVMVLGESSARYHWQLFGYERATNPELSRLPGLVLIPDMLTLWPESVDAIPQMLTRKPTNDNTAFWPEASILRAMQEAGYETYWISNQLPIGQFDSAVSIYASEAQHMQFLNHASWNAPGSFDEDMLQPLRDVLRGSNHDLFIVLHMMGSHLTYDLRYPASFNHFQSSDTDKKSIESLTDSYDNTILYTDHVLAQIVDILRNSGAVSALWFESDHGEMLPTPTCLRSGHGLGTRYEYQIPALFWYSDAYAALFPDRVAGLRANADRRTLSADTFESLIDMAGVDFQGHDESRSLFSPEWRFRTRTLSWVWQVDFDQATFGKNCPVVLPK